MRRDWPKEAAAREERKEMKQSAWAHAGGGEAMPTARLWTLKQCELRLRFVS